VAYLVASQASFLPTSIKKLRTDSFVPDCIKLHIKFRKNVLLAILAQDSREKGERMKEKERGS